MFILEFGSDPEHNCHEPLGVANSGLIPFYWLHGSDGFAYRGRLNKAYAWISTKPLYSEVNEKDPKQYSWLQVKATLTRTKIRVVDKYVKFKHIDA